MVVTINTDASYCHKRKAAGYAFWITSKEGRVKRAGKLRKAETSFEAEAMAIANALHVFITLKLDCTYLIINTDCANVITAVKHRSPADVIKKISKLIDQTGIKKYELRHVKAHSGKKDARSFVNEWCDKMAKYHMRREM